MKKAIAGVVAAFAVFSVAQAQSIEDLPAKQKFVRTMELPDAVAFNMLLLRLETNVSAGYRDDIVEEVSKNLGFDQDQSSAFLDQILAVKPAMNSEVQLEVKKRACSRGDGYSVLQSLYDVEEQVQSRHLDLVLNTISSNQQAAFRQWLDEEKTTITHVRVDFEKLDERSGKTAQSRLASICNADAVRQGTFVSEHCLAICACPRPTCPRPT